MNTSTLVVSPTMSLDCGGFVGLWSAPLKWISLPVFGGIMGVITIYTCGHLQITFSDGGSLELISVSPQ
jgi:hypothetical protein